MPTIYIFGYGSLVQIESRTRTVPSAFAAAPVIVKGITRGWYAQTGGVSLNPTYLGAVHQENATTNGVRFRHKRANCAFCGLAASAGRAPTGGSCRSGP